MESQNKFPTINPLPAVIPPTTYMNFMKNWWQRSSKTADIAESRIIQRVYDALPSITNQIPTLARMGRIPIDDEGKSLINTLYITQRPDQDKPYQFDSKRVDNLDTIIQQENKQKNLVICHGYGAGLAFFYRNYQELSQAPGWRLFSLDWSGMGNSSRPKWTILKKSNQTWDDIVSNVEDHFVESLESWRKKVGLDKMTLFGHSLGGYFSACYALKYPERVEKLILVSPAGIPNPPPETITKPSNPQETLQKEAEQVDTNFQEGEKPVDPPRRKIPAWATYLWNKNVTPMSIVRMTGPFGPRLVHSYTSRRFAHLTESEQHDFYDYLYHITSSNGSGEYALAAILAPGAYARKPLLDRLANLKMPTVFIYGEQDWMDYKAAEDAKKNMKVPVKIIRIASGGHHMYLENPEDFNKAVREEMQN